MFRKTSAQWAEGALNDSLGIKKPSLEERIEECMASWDDKTHIATAGGSSITGGATGRNMPECMGAWDKATHITQTKWREICARTLTEEHMY